MREVRSDPAPFPNYAAKFGWQPTGKREDDPKGRDATTVYYEKDGRELAYTIVSGDALDPPEDARTFTVQGVEYRVFEKDGRNVITWERDGKQYVTIASGIGGVYPLFSGDERLTAVPTGGSHARSLFPSRMLVASSP